MSDEIAIKFTSGVYLGPPNSDTWPKIVLPVEVLTDAGAAAFYEVMETILNEFGMGPNSEECQGKFDDTTSWSRSFWIAQRILDMRPPTS